MGEHVHLNANDLALLLSRDSQSDPEMTIVTITELSYERNQYMPSLVPAHSRCCISVSGYYYLAFSLYYVLRMLYT